MFRISRRLDYGIQMMILLAQQPDKKPQPTAILAEKLDIPLPFLHQIGHTLMQIGMIKSQPGPHGGLRLNQSPSDITVLRIAEALEGQLSVNSCVNCEGSCPKETQCAQLMLWRDLQQSITQTLSQITLADLAAQQQNLETPLAMPQRVARSR